MTTWWEKVILGREGWTETETETERERQKR